VISSQSEDQAIFDIQKALEVKSCPSMGLHLLGAEGPNLVLSKSCNINQLENAIVCDFAIHHVNEIVQWATEILIPPLAAQRLASLPERQSLTERLLRKPDPRPLLKNYADESDGTTQGLVSRQIGLVFMGNQIKVSLTSATESTIYLEVEANADKPDVGKTVQVTDGGTQQEAFILGRIGNRYALAQTASPLSLRQGMRIPYTTAVTITRGGDRTALGCDLSQKGLSVHEPSGLVLYVGMEVLLTTRLTGSLNTLDINFELSREPGYVARFFEQGGERFVGIEFKTPQPELLDLIEQATRFPDPLRSFMDHKKQEYEQRIAGK
jgi:hypothetical protein